ncbi:MAG: 4a-hydroxytetrahydrobiopterin dehydratase [Pseudomonadota bacterium]|nr:4a-hydroxytetrahydrobiopterin dehydratase [Pseudomonadota bacterium]
MSDDLKDKICVPCQGGIPPLTIEEAKSLLQKTPGWELQEEATRLYRSFTVNDFQTALDFVNKVGVIAEEEGHHPDIKFGWGYINILVFTHKINGLHENDFILAAKINVIA